VYGGAVVAQCPAATQKTFPPPAPANGNAEFLVHSMHCGFVLAGDAAIPISTMSNEYVKAKAS